jgi:Fe2+ or Zn2+ uptake regulation protein
MLDAPRDHVLAAHAREVPRDANVTAPHHPRVCESCGEIRDVQPRGEAGLTLPAAERRGFKVSAVDIVFRGSCTACAAKEARPGAAARARRARPRLPAR